MELYINRNGEQFGPYSEERVRANLEAGIFQLTDFAWYEGADDWMPLSAVPGFDPPGVAHHRHSGHQRFALLSGLTFRRSVEISRHHKKCVQ